MRTLAFLVAMMIAAVASAEEYKGIFWNLHSGDSDANTIASQMAAKGPIDFWGLSEVQNQSFLNTLTSRIRSTTNINYEAKLSDDPNNADKLAIIYNADRLTPEPYSGTHPVDQIGDDFFEVETVRLSSGLRPSLGIQLKDENGQSVVVLVNHFKASPGGSNEAKRKKQAEATDVFVTMTPGIPVIIGGDHNMALQAGGTGLTEPAFGILDQQCDYLEPTNASVAGTFRNGRVLDSVWVANDLAAYESEVTILNREGNIAASTRTFSDTDDDTDHRPLLMTIESDPDIRIEALEEDIEILEDTLARMKRTLDALKDARQ